MKNIAIYGKSISENNLQFLETLIITLKNELSPQLFIHKSLKEHSSLIERFNIKFFDGQDLIVNGIDLLISFGGDGTLLDTWVFSQHYSTRYTFSCKSVEKQRL